ncbi:MAG: hypothetical protein KAG97_11505 [Victivallales bacterium]|nr:hypothetical protein [Victivallales bacterium]
MTILKENLWLWGQNAGSHHAASANQSWKLPGVNRMGPVEGAESLGIENICRVVMGGAPEPPFDSDSERMKNMRQVVWSAMGDAGSTRNDEESDLDEVLRQAAKFANVTGAVLDDFFVNPEFNDGKAARLAVDEVRVMRDRLHACPARPLDLWVVSYKRQLDWHVEEYLELFDVISYWNMKASDEFDEIEDDFGKIVAQTLGKRRMLGCYMWNYGAGKPLSFDEIQAQCELYSEIIERGDAEGIIFCSNCCADLGLDAVEWVREWIAGIR